MRRHHIVLYWQPATTLARRIVPYCQPAMIPVGIVGVSQFVFFHLVLPQLSGMNF
jgi:hypothetical protein